MKRLLIPGLILIIAIAVWLAQDRLESSRMSGKTRDNFLNLDVNQINKILIVGPNGHFQIELDEGRWFLVDGRPRLADSMAIKNILTSAAELEAGTIVSQNPERQREFMVDSLSGNLVQFYSGERILSQVIIGKMSQDYSNTYIRIPGSNDVYLAPGQLSFNFGRNKTQWLDRTILSLAPESIKQVEFIYSDKAYRIQKDSTVWRVGKRPYSDLALADSAKTTAFINRLSRLSANDFVGPQDAGSASFEKPIIVLQIAADSLYSLEIAQSSADSLRFYCKRADLSDTLVISKSNVEFLKKDFSSFLP